MSAKELYVELQNVEKKYTEAIRRMANQPAITPKTRGGGRGGSGAHGLFKGEKIVERGFESLPGQLAGVQSGYEAVGVAAETASRVMRLPLGVGVGLAAVVLGVGRMREKYLELKKANEEARTELSKPFAGGSIEQLRQQATAADQQLKNLKANTGFMSVAADFYAQKAFNAWEVMKKGAFAKTTGGTPEVDENLTAQQGLYDKKFAISAEIANASKEEAAANQIMASQDAQHGEVLKAELATRQKIAAINADENLMPDAKVALKKQAKSDGLIAVDAINKKYFEQQSQLVTLGTLANLRGAKEKQVAAALDAQLATAHRLERSAQTVLEKEDARTKLAQARKAISEFRAGEAVSAIDRRNTRTQSNISASTAQANVNATPEQAQRNDLQSGVAKAKAEFAAAQAAYLRTPNRDTAASQTQSFNGVLAARAQLAKFERETAYQNAQELKSAKATTNQMQLLANGESKAAKLAGIRADYEERIARALHAGKTAIAAQLKGQQRLATVSAAADQMAMTPQEQNDQANADREQKRRMMAAAGQLADKEDRRARGAYDSNGTPDATGVGPDGRIQRNNPNASPNRAGRMSNADWANQFQARDVLSTAEKTADGKPRSSDAEWRAQFQPGGSKADQVRDGVQNPATSADEAGGGLKEAAADLKAAAADLKNALTNQ